MRRTTLATLLLGGGLLLGLAAAVGLALGAGPPRLSPFMLKVVMYKLAFIAALGLITAGAFVRRWARRSDHRVGHGPGAR